MKWTPGGSSQNVEDRRGQGGGMLPGGRAGLGIGGAVVLLVLSLIFGRDFVTGDTSTGDATAVSSGEVASTPDENRLVQLTVHLVRQPQPQSYERQPRSLLGGRQLAERRLFSLFAFARHLS